MVLISTKIIRLKVLKFHHQILLLHTLNLHPLPLDRRGQMDLFVLTNPIFRSTQKSQIVQNIRISQRTQSILIIRRSQTNHYNLTGH
jgi:hypothetical protein